jgi:TonB-dependent receptor
MIHKETFRGISALRLMAVMAALILAPASQAQGQAKEETATGFLEGRVFNAATETALESARVTVEGTSIFAVTDGIGYYHIGPIPAGEKRLVVTYTGFRQSTGTVVVESGKTVQKDFDLRVPYEGASVSTNDEIVQLEKYTVVSDRALSAQAIALNERKEAGNIKNVVAIDEYGYLGDENVGEFLRYLPGVAIDESGDTPAGVMLRGFPSANTNIRLDGSDIASATGSRTQSLLSVPMGNVSRIEVTKVPTPDMPAAGLGGSINLISSSGFIRRTARLDYSVYYTMLNSNLGIEGGSPGPIPSLSPKFQQPSFSLSYVLPVSRRLALTASFTRTWRNQPMDEDRNDTQADWNLVTNYQRQSTWMALAHLYKTWTAQIGAAWRVSRSGMLEFGMQQRHFEHELLRLNISLNYGGGATGDQYYSQGSASSNGTILQSSGPNRQTGTDTTHSSIKYTHSWTRWKLEMAGSWSYNKYFQYDISRGYFNSAPARIQNAEIRGEGIGDRDLLIPSRFSARKAGVPIDIYSGDNYVIGQPNSTEQTGENNRYMGRIDLSRDLNWRNVTASIKIGGLYDIQQFEYKPSYSTWTFTPVGVANIASNFDVFDQNFNLHGAPAFAGGQLDWINVKKLYQLYVEKPEWFVLDEGTTHINNAQNDRKFSESITSGYLRWDMRLFSNKLWIIAGARYERTDDEAWGMLNDPNAIYERNDDGSIRRGADLLPVLKPEANTALNRTKMQYQTRGAHTNKHYADIYPSVNMSYTITPNIILRAAYARTIGRPNLSYIVPGTTINSIGDTEHIINVNNPNLKPWTANGYDLSLEFYGIKDGHGSIGVFQKNIKNFFGIMEEYATPDTAGKYGFGWSPDFDEGSYIVRTRHNAGDAKITGYEFTWTQKLTFLPHWARGIRVFFNATKLELSGSNTADFAGYAPENYSGGMDFVRSRYQVKLGITYQAETKGSMVAVSDANGIPEGTYNYRGEAFKMRLNAEYSISKKFTLYTSIMNIEPGGNITINRRYASGSPEYVKDYRRQDLGMTITVGVKGTF